MISDPHDYLFRGTIFDAHFAGRQRADRERAASLFDAAHRVLACWTIDRARFRDARSIAG